MRELVWTSEVGMDRCAHLRGKRAQQFVQSRLGDALFAYTVGFFIHQRTRNYVSPEYVSQLRLTSVHRSRFESLASTLEPTSYPECRASKLARIAKESAFAQK
jgi:transcriptional regulator GlxA family with amidase domain